MTGNIVQNGKQLGSISVFGIRRPVEPEDADILQQILPLLAGRMEGEKPEIFRPSCQRTAVPAGCAGRADTVGGCHWKSAEPGIPTERRKGFIFWFWNRRRRRR